MYNYFDIGDVVYVPSEKVIGTIKDKQYTSNKSFDDDVFDDFFTFKIHVDLSRTIKTFKNNIKNRATHTLASTCSVLALNRRNSDCKKSTRNITRRAAWTLCSPLEWVERWHLLLQWRRVRLLRRLRLLRWLRQLQWPQQQRQQQQQQRQQRQQACC